MRVSLARRRYQAAHTVLPFFLQGTRAFLCFLCACPLQEGATSAAHTAISFFLLYPSFVCYAQPATAFLLRILLRRRSSAPKKNLCSILLLFPMPASAPAIAYWYVYCYSYWYAYWYALLVRITGTLYWYALLVRFTGTLYWYALLVRITGTLYWYALLVRFTGTLYWYALLVRLLACKRKRDTRLIEAQSASARDTRLLILTSKKALAGCAYCESRV